jgi:hypothetical protein
MPAAAAAAALALATLLTFGAPAAHAAVTLTPGANTVSTSKLELNFGDSNVERVDGVQWRNGAGTLGGNLVAAGGPAPSCAPGDVLEAWGQAYGDTNVNPILVAAGSAGTWDVRGTRTAEIASSEPTSCTGETTPTPVRTRYTFFDTGAAANKVRIERRFSFNAMSPAYPNTLGLRPYVQRMSTTYDKVLHPNAAGNALVSDNPCPDGCLETNWNGTWLAINNSSTHAGLIILRDPANTSPAKLLLDYDSFSGANNSSVDLTKPAGDWKATLTEVEYLCFYDVSSWPSASRTALTLPPGCSAAAVPVNTAVPTVSGIAKEGEVLTAAPGSWDSHSGAFSYQWSRCAGSNCTAIPSATSATYTATEADVGKQLHVAVTATATGGETDSASSAPTAQVQPIPPVNTAAPVASGSAASGQTLTADPGSWKGAPTSFGYQWRRCDAGGGSCGDIAGAVAQTYVVSGADLGGRLRVRVVATNAAGPSAPADSAATPVVAAGNVAPTNTRPPAITSPGDPPRVGDPLTAQVGAWTGSPSSYRYQWLRCNGFGADCGAIPGATQATYPVAAADLEKTIRVRVVAVNGGGDSAPVDSPQTAFVRQGVLTARLTVNPNPTCTGSDTLFDGSQSTGPAPIVRYRFEYISKLGPSSDERETGEGTDTVVVSDGAASQARRVFSWNLKTDPEPPHHPRFPTEEEDREYDAALTQWYYDIYHPYYLRSDVTVDLTVTDSTGASAKATQDLHFAQRTSKASRRGCPIPIQTQVGTVVARIATSVRVGSNAVTAIVPCAQSVDCSGQIVATKVSGFASAAKRRRAQPFLALQSFSVKAGKKKRVRAKLTRKAIQTVRKRGRLRAKVKVSLVAPTGKVVTRTRTVTFRAHRRGR